MKSLIGKMVFLIGTVLLSFFLWLQLEPNKAIVDNTKDEPTQPKQEEQASIKVHMKRSNGEELDLDVEVYLQGVVGSEMPASFELEALKAQAVAARTFVSKREFQVDDTTASQVYHDEEERKGIWKDNFETNEAKIKQAIDDTKGEIMTYQGELITASFFSSCNGYTNNSEDYWKDAQAYLRSVASPWDTKIDGYEQSVTFDAATFANALGFQNPVSNIEEPVRYENGYVNTITMDGIVFTGRQIRESLKLRSSSFTIQMDGTEIVVTTQGYGHGIGMSQYGAQGMALEGTDYQSILHHYYQDVEITQLHV